MNSSSSANGTFSKMQARKKTRETQSMQSQNQSISSI
jgi:hypothetical protein